MKQLILFMGPKYSTLKYLFLIWLTSVWFVIELLLLVTPHAQRERGKVIGRGVHIYIYTKYSTLPSGISAYIVPKVGIFPEGTIYADITQGRVLNI